jgi:acyl dehydratase
VALNIDLIGKEYPPVRYEVGREKLREFARSLGEQTPLYHDEAAARAAGFPDLPAVPTFAVVISLRAGQQAYDDPELGLDYSRVVHGEQELAYERPLYAGDLVVATARIAAASARGRHEVLTLETRIRTDAGEAVCTTRSTLIVRSGSRPAEQPSEQPAAAAPGAPSGTVRRPADGAR